MDFVFSIRVRVRFRVSGRVRVRVLYLLFHAFYSESLIRGV